MTSVFLDTSGLIAVANTDDQWHQKAGNIWDELNLSAVRMITTSLVLIELADGLSRVHQRSLAIQLLDALRVAEQVER